MNEKEYKISRSWSGPYDKDPPCIYNTYVGCGYHKCDTCGWNPFVSIERLVLKYGNEAADYLTKPGN